MGTWTKRFLIFVGTFVGVNIAWRIAARWLSLPCPPWLGWLLENPYVNAVASAETVLDRVGLENGMRLLDVGCGPGRLTVPAARQVLPAGEVVAVDIQTSMLAQAKQRVQEAGLHNVRFLHAGLGQGRLEEDRFDRALLVTVLGEIPDQETALSEIWRALKPGGVLSITEVFPDPHYQPRDKVGELASKVGFQHQATYGNWLAFTMNFIIPVTTQ